MGFRGCAGQLLVARRSLLYDEPVDLTASVLRAQTTTRSATSPRRDDDDFTQPLRSDDEDRIRTFLLGYPGVTAIRRSWSPSRVRAGCG